MDQAADIGLGDHHRWVSQPLADLGGQHGGLGGSSQNCPGGISQNPQTVMRLKQRLLWRIVAISPARVLVNPSAQIDEVLILQPA